jgi:stage II sporulation protein D
MRPRVIPVAAVLAALVPAAPAHAAGGWVVRGAGFGHGVGMSQYGAHGMAQEGAGYRRILGHYYRGTAIENVGGRTIRVLLLDGESSVPFRGAVRIGGRKAEPGRTYTARRLPGRRVIVRAGRRLVGRFPAPLVLRGEDAGLKLRGRYRGTFEISPHGERGLAVVNALPIDPYVQGVVAGEMPSSFDSEALKVQAVAARTYALTTDAGGDLFDQYRDIRSQVYLGITGETARTNRAVRATAGEILTFRGAPAVTYYSSTSGGRTENVENAFPGASPVGYLRSVPDPADRISPYHRWAVRFSRRGLERRLRGIVRGRFRGVRIVRRGRSPRVVTAEVVGSRGRRRVHGNVIRERLELRSTWFRFEKAG